MFKIIKKKIKIQNGNNYYYIFSSLVKVTLIQILLVMGNLKVFGGGKSVQLPSLLFHYSIN